MRLSNFLVAVSVLAAATGTTALARPNPLGSSFSYQGLLKSSGTPYSGTADFQFSLWENVSGVPQVGGTLPINGVVVTNGVFSASLDFGMLAFNGSERWLEIAVHTPSNGGAGPYTTLAPRQRIDAVPYALYAINALIAGAQPNAVALNNAANTYSGSSMSLDGGTFHVDAVNNRVGIGTTTPAATLDVHSDMIIQNTGLATGYFAGIFLRDGTSSTNSTGMLAKLDNDLWVGNGTAGGVVLGTSPFSGLVGDRLHVYPSGRIRMGPTNIGREPVSAVQIFNGASGLIMNSSASLALERNNHNYLNILAPDANETGVLFGKPTGGNAAGGIIYNSAGTLDGLQFRTGGNNIRLAITSAGNVGIGTIAPEQMLSVNGGLNIDQSNSNNGDLVNALRFGSGSGEAIASRRQGGTNQFGLDFWTASAKRMSIANLGNVGIGTDIPGTKLHILNGNAAMNSLQSENSAAAGTDVGSGVVGITSQANTFAAGVRGLNINAIGTGVTGTGNNAATNVLAGGSGGAFTGNITGVAAYSNTGGTGEALYTRQFFDEVRVGFWNGSSFFKIIGTGTVSTIVRDIQDKPVTMFAPESPEVLFQDFGDGLLINGFAHIDLDPTFGRNVLVDPTHPMRVFIQLEDNEQCQGVVVKNKTPTGFDVMELRGGRSNTPFTYQISARRADETLPSGRVSRYADLRFPPAPEARAQLTAQPDADIGVVRPATDTPILPAAVKPNQDQPDPHAPSGP